MMAEGHNKIPEIWTELGAYARVAYTLLKEDQPTKSVLAYLKDQIILFGEKLAEKSDEIVILCTGSSYDGLSITRFMKLGKQEKWIFVPETDFDYIMEFRKHCVKDCMLKPERNLSEKEIEILSKLDLLGKIDGVLYSKKDQHGWQNSKTNKISKKFDLAQSYELVSENNGIKKEQMILKKHYTDTNFESEDNIVLPNQAGLHIKEPIKISSESVTKENAQSDKNAEEIMIKESKKYSNTTKPREIIVESSEAASLERVSINDNTQNVSQINIKTRQCAAFNDTNEHSVLDRGTKEPIIDSLDRGTKEPIIDLRDIGIDSQEDVSKDHNNRKVDTNEQNIAEEKSETVSELLNKEIKTDSKPSRDVRPKEKHSNGYPIAKDNNKGITFIAEMFKSEEQGYVILKITEYGKTEFGKPGCTLINEVQKDGIIPNTLFLKEKSHYVQSGPALSNFENYELQNYSYDFVYAFPTTWPAVSLEWITRERKGWPSDDVIKNIVEEGCDVVPVGYYTGINSNEQWRLSFNKSERILSQALNETQRMCYVIAKLLCKQSLPKRCILSSYHLKNLLYWLCEDHPSDEWEIKDLGKWIFHLLHWVSVSLRYGNIAHYFLPDNNMIRHRSTEDIEYTLKYVKYIVDKPMATLSLVCQKLQMCTKKSIILSPKYPSVEIQESIMLYTAFSKTLHDLVKVHIGSDLALECFKMIILLNIHAHRDLPRQGTLYTAEDLPSIMYPFALACAQDGSFDSAIWLYSSMLEIDYNVTVTKFPKALINLACAYHVKAQTASTEDKDNLIAKATRYFEEASRYNRFSVSYHFLFGQFLYSIDCHKEAEKHLMEVITTESDVNEDENAFINIDLPENKNFTPLNAAISPKIGAYYFHILSSIDNHDVVSAIKLCETMEKECQNSEVNQDIHLNLCATANAKIAEVFQLKYKEILTKLKEKKQTA